jgi:hypothetical protein
VQKDLKQLVCVGVLLCVGCSKASLQLPGTEPVDWITGREALQKIMSSAKKWSSDAEAIRLFSGYCKKAPHEAPHEGVCDEWRAVVRSPSLRKTTGFYWSRGNVTHGEVTDYEPQPNGERPVEASKIKADSDAAFRAAKEYGGKPLLDKNPEIEIRYAMMLEKKIGQLVWLVFYDIKGTDISSAKLYVAINAETGDFIR